MKVSHLVCLGVVIFSSATSWAFKQNFHSDNTKAALAAISATVDGKALKFTPKAINEAAQANVDVDCGGDAQCVCRECQSDPSRHFDNESFGTSSLRILRLKEAIIANITSPSPAGTAARASLGQALHTIEDFYAHSTWVQIKGTAINPKLGRESLSTSDNDIATASAQVCSDANHEALTNPVGAAELTTGFFSAGFDNGSGLLGICWVGPTAGKCRHGDFRSNDPSSVLGVCPEGISQDRPGRPFYSQARTAATAAVVDFVNQILAYNGERLHSGATYPAVRNNARGIKALFGIRITTLGIIMDTTGSMGSIQTQVKAAVGDIVRSLLGTEDEPGTYLLEPYNDPSVGPPVKTSDSTTFLAAVNALSASGGGDCPEKTFSALLDAISASDPQAVFFLFTDASANDGYLADDVILAAQQKGIVIKFALFGSCSPTDPNYLKVAAATGGQVFVLDTSETAKTFALVKADVRSNPVTIAATSGTLSTPREFVIPVDSTQRSVTFSTSVIGTHTSTRILRPTGAQVVAGDPGVTITDLSSGRIVSITPPQPGAWRVQLSGSGDFTVAAVGDSLLKFEDFQFVSLAGRAGHGGYFPIAGQPLAGRPQTGMAVLSGPFSTASFQLVSPQGDVLQTATLATGNADASSDAFVGAITIPAAQFRVVVTGIDSAGSSYQRVFSQVFQGQSVSVSAAATTSALPVGTTVSIPFVVRNGAAAATYRIEAADSRRFVSGVTPVTLTLAPNASATVQVGLTVPADAGQGTIDSVSLTATSTTDSTITNGASAAFTVDRVLAKTSIGFLNQVLGAGSPTQSVVIRNSGAAPMAIQQIAVSEEFTQTNDCTATLAVGAQCTVTVRSNPATLGERSGVVTILDDSAASPRVVVLRATGIDFALATAGPRSATVRAGQAASFTLNLSTQGGALGEQATFECAGLPPGVRCTFNPATLAAGTDAATVALTVATTATAAFSPDGLTVWSSGATLATLAWLAFVRIPNRRLGSLLSILAFMALLLQLNSCGGGSGDSSAQSPTYNIDVTARSGGASRSAPISVTVN